MRGRWAVPVVAGVVAALLAGGNARAAGRAQARIEAKSGSAVSGEVTFEEVRGGLAVRVDARDVPPGEHGFHVHEKGDCSSSDGKSAGGHFNPARTRHGGPGDKVRHAGDLGNVVADGSGRVRHESLYAGIALGKGPNSIVGKAVILHAKADDLRSQPTGDAGGRIACGVIRPAR